MYVARENRIQLAKRYSKPYGPVSKKLLERKLPSGNEWTAGAKAAGSLGGECDC